MDRLVWDMWRALCGGCRLGMGCSLVMVTGDVGIGMWLGWVFGATDIKLVL